MPVRWTICGGLILALCAGTPAQAGPPYTVDDPGTLDHRGLFLYTSYIGSWQNGTVSDVLPQLVLGYGLRPDLEFAAGVSGFTSNVPGAVAFAPLGDPALAVKWRFQEETLGSPALAVGYQATVITVDAGLGSGFLTHSLWLTGSRTVGKGLLWGNLGVNVYPRPHLDESAYYGLAYDYPLGRRLRVGAELHGNAAAPASGVTGDLTWGIGATYALSSRNTLLLQAGRSFQGTSDFNLYAGILMRLNR